MGQAEQSNQESQESKQFFIQVVGGFVVLSLLIFGALQFRKAGSPETFVDVEQDIVALIADEEYDTAADRLRTYMDSQSISDEQRMVAQLRLVDVYFADRDYIYAYDTAQSIGSYASLEETPTIVLLALSSSADASGDYPAAQTYFAELVKRYSAEDSEEAKSLVSDFEKAHSRLEDTIAQLKANQLPIDTTVLQRRAELLAQSGHTDEALSAYKDAIELRGGVAVLEHAHSDESDHDHEAETFNPDVDPHAQSYYKAYLKLGGEPLL